jgi:hypothetical protein
MTSSRVSAQGPQATAGSGARVERGGVTWRAVALSLALLAVMCPVAFYVEIVWYKRELFTGIPATAPVVLLFLLAAAGALPGLRRLSLDRKELLVVYSALLVAGPLFSASIMVWMLCKTVSFIYMGHATPVWQTVFLTQVPSWFAPADAAVVEAFFQGNTAVPWAHWRVPLTVWSLFMLCLFVCSFCAITIVQRQWIASERLSFPFSQVPLELVQEHTGDSTRAHLPGRSLFWVGLGVSFLVSLVNDLSQRYPAIPAIPLGPVPIMPWQRVGPLAGLGEIDLVLWPWMIAIAYLIPKELSFSTWFFWVVDVGLTIAAVAAGAEPQRPEEWFGSTFPAPRYQGGGAAIALGVWALWIGRTHLAYALRCVFRPDPARESGEPLSYRWAFLGLVSTFLGLLYFGWAAGCRLLVSLVLMGSIVGYYVVWARLRAETGLGFLPFPLEIQNAMMVPFGTAAFTAREYITMMSTRWAFFPGFGSSYEVCTGSALETMKIADAAHLDRRRLARLLLGAFVFALIIGAPVILTGIYRYGALGLTAFTTESWLGSQSLGDGARIAYPLMNPAGTDVNGVIAMLAGAVVAVALGLMRLRFWWWPLHPVGYMAAMCWGLHWYYMPFFIGWAAKTLVIRYGGLRLFRQTVPLAIGLIVGDLLNGGVWMLVALLSQGRV